MVLRSEYYEWKGSNLRAEKVFFQRHPEGSSTFIPRVASRSLDPGLFAIYTTFQLVIENFKEKGREL
jgi:hypothetical protein